MTDNEKRELDRWLDWAGGEVNKWWSRETLHFKFEASARKSGEFLRAIEADRHDAIKRLKERYEAAAAPGEKKPKTRCASCPQAAAEEFKVRCSDTDAGRAGVKLTGPWVDTSWDGSPIREETVPLCPRCVATELRRLVGRFVGTNQAEWLKAVRSVP